MFDMFLINYTKNYLQILLDFDNYTIVYFCNKIQAY